jgi:hypothetical protein
MPFFVGMSFADLQPWLICARASLGDGVIVIFIFLFGRLIFKSWNWIDHINPMKIIYLIFIGLLITIVLELISLKYQRWSYSEMLPVIQKIDVGIIPIIQMILLSYLSYVVTSRIFSLLVKKHKK